MSQAMTKRKNAKKPPRAPRKIVFNVDPSHFFNRDLSWLAFNSRVLHEAADARNPVLERLRFLIIFTSNLDEFVMKRIGRIKRQMASGVLHQSVDGLAAEKQFSEIRKHILEDIKKQTKIFVELMPQLEQEGIKFLTYDQLQDKEKKECDQFFQTHVFPVLTPLSVDPGHPFPFISNLSFSLGINLSHPKTGVKIFSRVKIPRNVTPWLRLSGENGFRFVRVASIIRQNIHALYPGMVIDRVTPFRVTRNADIEHQEEKVQDLLMVVEEGLKERRLAECVRLEVYDDCDQTMLQFLMTSLEIDERDVYRVEYPMDYSVFRKITDLDLPKLKFKPWHPVVPQKLQEEGSLFTTLKQGDILVHHPYESFASSVERFIANASEDPQVMAIKMTLYRTGDNSPFIRHLIKAAELGKQVVCLIELKARFDEERNIFWAHKLEDAGVHVVYGILGLKIHTKLALVVREESDGQILSYAHVGTGNYNMATSNHYTDLGLLTSDKRLTGEIHEVFNFLTGSSLKTDYAQLMVAPINMKSKFLLLIKEESELAKKGIPAKIIAKMNSLEDEVITEALYEASRVGVSIELFVRGFCCLKPQIKGLSENITVTSIIGRFLEHSRFFYFSKGKKDIKEGEIWLGSADWMYRNLHTRVELIVPIFDPKLKEKIGQHIEMMQKDNRNAWILQSDGKYIQRQPKLGESEVGTHELMMKWAQAQGRRFGESD